MSNKDIKKVEQEVLKIHNLCKIGNYELAISNSKKGLIDFGPYVEFYLMLGLAYKGLNNIQLSISNFEKVIETQPNQIIAINNLGILYKNKSEFIKAEEFFNKAIKIDEKFINAYVNLANLKRDINKLEESITLYRKALSINSEIAEIHYNLAQTYQNIGDMEKAIYHCDETLRINKKFTNADRIKANCFKYTNNHPHISEMENKIKEIELTDYEVIQICYALGKAYEDTSEIDKSFHYIKKGSDKLKMLTGYTINEDEILFQKIKKIFHKLNIKDNLNLKIDKKIIFVLGMPRSGTSLVEQILSMDKNAYSGGELQILTKVIGENFAKDKQLDENIKLENLNKDDLIKISDEYFRYLEPYNNDKKIIIDKAPLNFRWIGWIKLFFPNSKILHCTRNAKDNCLSIYKNYFERSLNWGNNQKDLGKFFKMYTDLMIFWNNKFPEFIHEVNYEKLIENFETEVKSLIKFCDLSWSNDFLKHEKSRNPIKTASVNQARKPIYKSSIKSFEKFQGHLDELFTILDK